MSSIRHASLYLEDDLLIIYVLFSLVQVKAKKSIVKFVIDCTDPVDDKVLDMGAFEAYLHSKIKINNKTAQLAQNNVVLTCDRTKISVSSPAELNFSKRQLKYLAKRYLKKQALKEFLRVVAASKNSYELRYYKTGAADDAEDEE